MAIALVMTLGSAPNMQAKTLSYLQIYPPVEANRRNHKNSTL